jgi:hypothetical protein
MGRTYIRLATLVVIAIASLVPTAHPQGLPEPRCTHADSSEPCQSTDKTERDRKRQEARAAWRAEQAEQKRQKEIERARQQQIVSDFAACTNAGDRPRCVKDAKHTAARVLSDQLIKTVAFGHLDILVRVKVDDAVYPRYVAMKMLAEIARTAIDMAASKIKEDILRIDSTGGWPAKMSREQAARIIAKDEATLARWEKEAREESNKGDDWRRDAGVDGQNINYKFHPGHAYKQLKNISSIGWGKRQ